MVRDDYHLSYYFGGAEVAYRFTDQGVEVLAVGASDIEKVLGQLQPVERVGVIQETIRPW